MSSGAPKIIQLEEGWEEQIKEKVGIPKNYLSRVLGCCGASPKDVHPSHTIWT